MHTSAKANSLTYRPELDGLRAIAVMPVLFYHAGFESFSGGFVGVDVFFVISGFLITSIILDDLREENFSLAKFWWRRARRIIPALFIVMLVSSVGAWFILPPVHMEDFSQSILAMLLFSSNFLFWYEHGYFDAASELKPLIHTWSLSIEEQYYFVFPLLMILLWKRLKESILFALIAIAAGSFLLTSYVDTISPIASFYLLPVRAWELLCGSILASAPEIFRNKISSSLVSNCICIISVLLLAYCVYEFDNSIPYPSSYTITPVLATAAIIAFTPSAQLAKNFLSNRWLVGTGLVSYSLYLWHQPLLAFLRHASMDTPNRISLCIVLLTSLLLAYFTWKYIETPCRKIEIVGTRKFTQISLTVATALYAIGYFGTSDNGLESRFKRLDQALLAYYDRTVDYGATKNECLIYYPFTSRDVAACTSTLERPIVALVGDSHAEVLFDSLRESLSNQGIDLVTLIRTGCLPIPATSRIPVDPNSLCFKFNLEVYTLIEGLNVEYLVLSSYWASNLLAENFDNREGGRITRARTQPYSPTNESGDTVINVNLADHISNQLNLLGSKEQLIVIGQIPETGWHVLDRIRAFLMRYQNEFEITTSYEVYLRRNEIFFEIESKLDPTIKVVNPSALVCDAESSGRCSTILEGKALYRDDNHATHTFSKMISDEIERIISTQ